jgi:NADH-quinone oxidoreductase subunit N
MRFNLDELTFSAPLLVVAGGGMLLLLLEAFSRARASGPAPRHTVSVGSRSYLAALALVVLGVAAALEVAAWEPLATPRLLYHGMIAADRFGAFLGVVFFVGAALSVLLGGPFMREHRFEFGEFYSLVLLATSGMMIFAQATDLVTVFIGLEVMSLSVYVLTGSWRRAARSSEAALKYFLVGSFASALLIYGVALVYGTTGTTNLVAIGGAGGRGPMGIDMVSAQAAAIPTTVFGDPIFLVGSFLIAAGLAFKIAAVPFHLWAPDTYEGAPTPVTAFMAAGVKAAGFAGVIRIFATAYARTELTFGPTGWASIWAVLAILTMTFGNVAALRQENLKRLLAYSAIAHAGYLLVGVAAMSLAGAEARGHFDVPAEYVAPMLFYLLAYTFTTVGSFAVIAWYGTYGDERQTLDEWAGLAGRHPAAALAMTVFLLSLAGFPPTAGFFGKFYVFRGALAKPGLAPLVVIAVLNSLVSVYYYLRPITVMYFREVGRDVAPIRSTGLSAALVAAAAGTLLLGIFPSWLTEVASKASLLLALPK